MRGLPYRSSGWPNPDRASPLRCRARRCSQRGARRGRSTRCRCVDVASCIQKLPRKPERRRARSDDGSGPHPSARFGAFSLALSVVEQEQRDRSGERSSADHETHGRDVPLIERVVAQGDALRDRTRSVNLRGISPSNPGSSSSPSRRTPSPHRGRPRRLLASPQTEGTRSARARGLCRSRRERSSGQRSAAPHVESRGTSACGAGS